MANELVPSTVAAAIRAVVSRIGRVLAHTSPVRLLLLICVTIAVTHSLTMISLQAWHTVLPGWAHSFTESALLVLVLFPALYFFSFRPLFAQIAERERAEATMWMSEHKYRSLFNSLGDAAFLVDVETGRIIDANQQAEVLLARPRAEIVGASQNLLFPAERIEEFGPQLRRRGDGVIGSFEAEVLTAEGRRVSVHVSAAPLSLAGRDLVVALFRDVTEFKTLHEELLRAQRLESVAVLAGGIAHDVNNALTPILFAAELLPAQRGGPGEKHLIETVSKSATRAAQIVRQLLTFARGGTSQQADLQLRHLLREAEDMARVAFPKSIQVQLQLPNELWPVRADAAQLSQVIMNLAVNARDAMPGGGELCFAGENLVVGDAGLSGVPDLKPGRYAVLRVSDSGCGIPPEHLKKIFDPFFTTKPVGKGTGLGLSIVRDIMRNHHGAIQVESRLGRGTTFSLFLPAALTSVEDAVKSRTEAMLKGNGELVLIADDETLVLEMARLALEAAGYRVLQASDGTEALASAIEHKSELNLAIVDREMPYLSGPATIRALHKAIPSLKAIEISGSMVPDEGGETPRAADQAFLQKPFSVEQLLEAVSAALRK
jgi:PAS domain S-box-containing protein